MRKLIGSALLVAAVAAFGFAAPAKADVIYTLAFDSSSNVLVGTGTLDLNVNSVSQAYNLNENLGNVLASITTTSLDGYSPFDITTANLASYSYISTGSIGQIYSLTAVETGPTNSIVLDLYTNSFQIHGVNNSTVASGSFTATGPSLAAVPEPLTLSIFGAGLAGAVAMRRRKKAKKA